MQAARKRPALANMLSHRWLQMSLLRSASPSSAASQAPTQFDAQATPLLGPPGPLSSTPTSSAGPSPLGLTPTEAPRVHPTSPNPDAGRHHSGVSRSHTAYAETSMGAELMASPSENRCVPCCIACVCVLLHLHTSKAELYLSCFGSLNLTQPPKKSPYCHYKPFSPSYCLIWLE